MQFDGEWLQCDDDVVRPIIRAEILGGNGAWRAFELLVDTGADRTVISANVLESLYLDATEPRARIGGVGGLVNSVSIVTQIRLMRNDGLPANFHGAYVACTDHYALDMSVLGRDILDMFALVVDRRSDVVAIVGGNHRYTIGQR